MLKNVTPLNRENDGSGHRMARREIKINLKKETQRSKKARLKT